MTNIWLRRLNTNYVTNLVFRHWHGLLLKHAIPKSSPPSGRDDRSRLSCLDFRFTCSRLSCLDFRFTPQSLLSYLIFQSYLQKRVVRTKYEMYVFISSESNFKIFTSGGLMDNSLYDIQYQLLRSKRPKH